MAQSKQFIVNGIEVTAVPVGNGMWCGMPNDPIGLLLKVLSGQVSLDSLLRVETVEEVQEQEPEVEEQPQDGYTLREYRENEGMSKTQFAEYIGVSRRSLGRYEAAGRLASEFGL